LGFGFVDVVVARAGFGLFARLVFPDPRVTEPRLGTALRLRATVRFSVGVRTMTPRCPRAALSLASSVAASAKGTSWAARRSTVAGSGIDRPVAASNGTGRQTPRKSRIR
jgi:hypothetical protein